MNSLDRLTLAAAVTSGWPVVHVHTACEEQMLAARSRIETALGPLPQTDEIEPWDDDDWELRIALPGADALTVMRAVDAAHPANVRVAIGPQPGLLFDLDRGRPAYEELVSDGITARCWSDPEHGGSGLRDLRRCPADAAIETLDVHVALALQEGGVTAAFHSDRGADTVRPVVHRPTGRLGVRVQFTPDAEVDRQQVVNALAALVRDRAEHPVLRLAPDLCWDVEHGTAFTVWLVAPRAAALPGDRVDPSQPGDVAARLTGLDATTPTIEVHIVPVDAAHSDAAVEAVAAFPLPDDALVGDLPRWMGSPPAFSAVWRLERDTLPARAIDDWAVRLQHDPAIAAVRVVPSAPLGLEDRWPGMHVAWRVFPGTTFVRIRDPLMDHDRQPERTPTDTPDWARGLADLPGVASLRGHRWADGAEAVAVHLVPDAVHPTVLDAVLSSIAAARPLNTRAVAWWAYQGDHAIVHLAATTPPTPESAC